MIFGDTQGLILQIEGAYAPPSVEVISAEFAYGAAGTCQAATIRSLSALMSGRDALWRVTLGDTPVFQGIPDGISDADGELAQVTLLAPHRPRLGGLGESLGGIQAGEFETLQQALERALGGDPAADIGINPSGREIAGEAGGGADVSGYAIQVRYIGPTYPDAITDAVFDPGEGWKKYAFRRYVDPFVMRRTGQAKAEPAIKEQPERIDLSGVPSDELLAPVGQAATYATFIGTPPKGYQRAGNVFTRRFGEWFWEWTYPGDSDTLKRRGVEVVVAFEIGSVTEQKVEFTFYPEGGALSAQGGTTGTTPPPEPIKETQTSRDDGTTVEVGLRYLKGDVWETLNATKTFVPRTASSTGTFTTRFTVDEKFVGAALRAYVNIKQTNGHSVQFTALPAYVSLKRMSPNVEGVVMPQGWEKPTRTSPRYEATLRGWHIPPLSFRGQRVASAVVTWNKNECVTKITTEAIDYV